MSENGYGGSHVPSSNGVNAGGSGGFQSGAEANVQTNAGTGGQPGQHSAGAPSLTPELQSQFDALSSNPQFKAWYDSQRQPQTQQAQPKPQTGVSPEVRSILDRMLPTPSEIRLEPNEPMTAESYGRMQQRDKLISFQNDIRGIFNKPFDVGGVSIDMSDPRKAQSFMDFARDYTSRAPTAKELAILHFHSELMAGARDSAGRRAEAAVQRGTVRSAGPGQTEQARVVVPQQGTDSRVGGQRSSDPNKVPNLAELVAADEGKTGDQWLQDWSRRTALGQ